MTSIIEALARILRNCLLTLAGFGAFAAVVWVIEVPLARLPFGATLALGAVSVGACVAWELASEREAAANSEDDA